jgi:Holliday junction resolvase-like predicted endonuclease
MALLDEQLVEEWLNRKQFFTIRGLKAGLGEIDLLAVQNTPNQAQYWHVEVSVSFRPMGYLGGDKSARKRTDAEIKNGIEHWVAKKFTDDKKVKARNTAYSTNDWQFVFVHGVMRDDKELEYLKELGVKTIPYKTLLTELLEDKNKHSSSVASNIVDILRYMKTD